ATSAQLGLAVTSRATLAHRAGVVSCSASRAPGSGPPRPEGGPCAGLPPRRPSAARSPATPGRPARAASRTAAEPGLSARRRRHAKERGAQVLVLPAVLTV